MRRAGNGNTLSLTAGQLTNGRFGRGNPNIEISQEPFGLRNHASPVEPEKRPCREFPAQKHIHVHRLAVHQSQVLVDDLYAKPLRVARVVEGRLRPLDQQSSARRLEDPGDHFDQSRLSGAVVADERDDFAGIHVETEILDRHQTAKGPMDVLEREDGQRNRR